MPTGNMERDSLSESVVTGQGVGLDSLWMPPPWNC